MSAPFVMRATALSATEVDVVFDQAVVVGAVLLDPLSYSFDGGVFPTAVFATSSASVRVVTTRHVPSRRYRVTVSAAVRNAGGEYLDAARSVAPFIGGSSAAESVVVDLSARTDPKGRRIQLRWTNPSPSPARCKIIRRLRSWPFDESDASTTVFDDVLPASVAVGTVPPLDDLTVYTDGTAVYVDGTGLLGNRFYYYVVMVGASSPYAIRPASRVEGFSASRTTFDADLWVRTRANIPRVSVARDSNPPGSGSLGDYLTTYAGLLRVVHGRVRSLLDASDMEEAAYSSLPARIRAHGYEPEGETYDFDTPRRMALMLPTQARIKGSIPGVVHAVRMLAGWIVEPQEFGVDARSRVLAAWTLGTETYAAAVSASFGGRVTPYAASDLPPTVGDGTATWATDQWQRGRVRDGMGNWLTQPVSNTSTILTLDYPRTIAPWAKDLDGSSYLAGVYTVTLGSPTASLLVGQRVQLWNRATGAVDVLEITQIDPATGQLWFWNRTLNAHGANSCLLWEVTAPQAAMYGEASGLDAPGELVPVCTGALRWITGQWAGMVLRDSGGVEYTVTTNDAGTMYLSPAGVVAAGSFRIAPVGGVSVSASFSVYSGEWRFLFDPLNDYELRGTRLDPNHYLYGGSFPLMGAWGPGDLGLYVIGQVDGAAPTVSVSRVTGVATGTITDTSANYTAGALVGMYLLPNQNQTRVFRIIANTDTTITVGVDLTGTAIAGTPYVVFTERNASRYSRLVKRISEFMPDDMRARILFM